jgi:hypothetical protein
LQVTETPGATGLHLSDEELKELLTGGELSEEEVIEVEAELGKRDFTFFCKVIRGTPTEDFHEEWHDLQVENDCTLVTGPRGSMKTEHLTVNYSLWLIINNYDIRILIASSTVEQATVFTSAIKRVIEHDEEFILHYGDLSGTADDKWTDHLFTIGVRENKTLREATVMAAGVGTSIPSRHFDVIILDDVVTPKNSKTAYLRADLAEWIINSIWPCLEEINGKIHFIGWMCRHENFYVRLREDECEKTNINTPALNPDGTSFWEQRFPKKNLEKIKKRMGEDWELIYQGKNRKKRKGVYGKWKYPRFTKPPSHLRKVAGVDLAGTEKSENNKSSIVVVGTPSGEADSEDKGHYYVLAAASGHWETGDLVRWIKSMYITWRFPLLAVEKNAMQVIWPNLIAEKTKYEFGVTGVDQKLAKEDRLLRWNLLFEESRVHFRRGYTEELVEHLLDKPGGDWDEVDSFDIAMGELLKLGDEEEGEFETWSESPVSHREVVRRVRAERLGGRLK